MFARLKMWFKNIFSKKSKKQEQKQEIALSIKDVEIYLKQISLEREQMLIGEFNDIFIDIKILIKEILDYLIHFEESPLPSQIGDKEKEKLNKSKETYSSKIRAILMNLNQRIISLEEKSKQEDVKSKGIENISRIKDSQQESETRGIREIEGKIYQPFKTANSLLSKNLTYDKMLLNNFFSSELVTIDEKMNKLKDLFEAINEKIKNNSEFFKEMDMLLKELKNFEQNRAIKVKKKGELPAIIDKYYSSKKLNERIKNREKELKSNNPIRYQEYKKIYDKIEELEKELDVQVSKIRRIIIPLHAEFDSYSDIYKVKKAIVNGYLTNSLQTYLEDEGLEIIQILNKIAALIDNGTIKSEDLDEKIEIINNAIKNISELNKQEIKTKSDNTINEIKKEKSKIRNNKSLNDFDDIYYKIKHSNSQFNYINDYVQEIKKITEEIKLVKTIQNIEKKINEKFGEHVEIIIDEKLKSDDKNIAV